MLQTLKIKNLAIVENVQVDFGRGLNVVTGETGAGKSIIIGALGLVLGGRSDKTMIRTNEEKCGVEAIFQFSDSSEIDSVLESLGLDPCDHGSLIVRRIITSSGTGKNFINDSPATVQALKIIGDHLVDMHGPHDHQSLLNRDSQMDILDSFGHLWKLREDYEVHYTELCSLEKRRRDLDCDDQDVAQQIDMLSFQIKEIEEAKLENISETELEQEHSITANAQQILELSEALNESLTENDQSVLNTITFARNKLAQLAEVLPAAEAWLEDIESASIQIQELSSSIAMAASSIEYNKEYLQQLEDRLSLIHKLKRKYGQSIDDILAFLQTANTKLRDLESREERISEIDDLITENNEKLKSAGIKLGKARMKTAASLAEAITSELRDLGFPHGSFEIGLQQCEPGPSGMDSIEFEFAPNVGETTRALRDIASSGEISRVMLAIKSILADHDKVPVLIFDEIDANVGGEMGNAIGSKLSAVSSNHQVLCITHLPQVAVHGTMHYVVAKTVEDGRTRTSIKAVDGHERTEEVARMLGGRDLTSVTMKHAEEMLKTARSREH